MLLTELWERTSSKGTRYLSGFIGRARLIAFQGEPRPDGTPTWKVYVQAGKDQEGGR